MSPSQDNMTHQTELSHSHLSFPIIHIQILSMIRTLHNIPPHKGQTPYDISVAWDRQPVSQVGWDIVAVRQKIGVI